MSMSSWAATFLMLALITGLLGFVGPAGSVAALARLLFNVFLFLFLVAIFVRNVWQNGFFRSLFNGDERLTP